jgi:excisionase family DNA binding protein
MAPNSDDQTESAPRRRSRPKLSRLRDSKAIYQERKNNPRIYEHIKAKNAAWMREHPDVNRRNQKLTRERRAQRKLEQRQRDFPGWITVAEAKALLQFSRQYVHYLIKNGELGETRRYGKLVLVRQSAVEGYRESRAPIK